MTDSKPASSQRERRVHARVVELDALPDAVRAGAQDHDPRPLGRGGPRSLLVGGVVVRRPRGELAGARVDRLETGRRPAPSRRRRTSPPTAPVEQRDARVGDAAPLRPAQARPRPSRCPCPAALRRQLEHRPIWSDEPRIDARDAAETSSTECPAASAASTRSSRCSLAVAQIAREGRSSGAGRRGTPVGPERRPRALRAPARTPCPGPP